MPLILFIHLMLHTDYELSTSYLSKNSPRLLGKIPVGRTCVEIVYRNESGTWERAANCRPNKASGLFRWMIHNFLLPNVHLIISWL